MLKMVCFALLFLLGLTNAGQESVTLLNLNDPTPMVLQTLSHTGIPVAVSVSNEDLSEISSSVLMAESWLRTHVLTHFPATQITTIVVANTLLCNRDHQEKWGLVLPSVKNIYHSLLRWGLEKEIKVSVAFSQDCLHPFSDRFRDDLAQNLIKPLLNFLQNSNSTYSVFPPSSSLSYKTIKKLVFSHTESIKKIGFFKLSEIKVLTFSPKETKPTSRKLSFTKTDLLDPLIPTRPTPLPDHVTTKPQPPFPQISPSPSPSMYFSFAPNGPPIQLPSEPPGFFTFSPPCNPRIEPSPTPEPREDKKLWCVAKPSVPGESLQEAMDYACGEGGADCEEIKPNGSCYYPDTVVAHASYAFNSYWQKNKNNEGTCSFGGTAMIINADPSFLHCRFMVS